MNFEELIDEVTIILQEPSTDITSRIGGWINDALADAIERANVPGFKMLTSVNTIPGQAYTVLDGSFSGKMLYVGTKYGRLGHCPLEDLLAEFPDLDQKGSLEMVSIEGNLLYYQGIPDDATAITLLYRKLPTVLVNPTDIPEGIPSQLHRKVLVPGAAMYGFSLIEDGIDGEKVNTRAQEVLYYRGIYELMEWVGRRTDHRCRNVWRY